MQGAVFLLIPPYCMDTELSQSMVLISRLIRDEEGCDKETNEAAFLIHRGQGRELYSLSRLDNCPHLFHVPHGCRRK